jgi:hypothetical protein
MIKYWTLAALLFLAAIKSPAQLKPSNACGSIVVDVYKGWINEAKPNSDPEQIKAKLPCFTSFEKEGNESKCGGGVYYADKDFKFLIQRDYIVIGEKFKGALNLPLFGMKPDDLFVKLGNPKAKDANWEAYQMAYGTLLVFYNDKQVIHKVIISTVSTDALNLCEEDWK